MCASLVHEPNSEEVQDADSQPHSRTDKVTLGIVSKLESAWMKICNWSINSWIIIPTPLNMPCV